MAGREESDEVVAHRDDRAVAAVRAAHPGADFLIHPECGCSTSVLEGISAGAIDQTDLHILSTEGMMRHARDSDKDTMIVATESQVDAQAVGDLRCVGLPGGQRALSGWTAEWTESSGGASLPPWMADLFEGLDDDPDTRRLVAASLACEQCRALHAGGVEQFHFYTLNKSKATVDIVKMLNIDHAA